MAQEYTVRSFKMILINNGYELKRRKGDHDIYSNGSRTISIPVGNKSINRMLARRLVKENQLMNA